MGCCIRNRMWVQVSERLGFLSRGLIFLKSFLRTAIKDLSKKFKLEFLYIWTSKVSGPDPQKPGSGPISEDMNYKVTRCMWISHKPYLRKVEMSLEPHRTNFNIRRAGVVFLNEQKFSHHCQNGCEDR